MGDIVSYTYKMDKEFEGIEFKSKRLKDRFIQTMNKMMEQPGQSIWLSSGSRSSAKAVYRMLGNEKLNREVILNCHKNATIERMKEHPIVLAVQDTTSVNYATRTKMQGLGYNCDKTLGINIHSCIAVTPKGLVLGVLDQAAYTREIRKDASASHDKKKYRPIEEKESYRWLQAMENSHQGIGCESKVIHVCDREGDMYELFESASNMQQLFLVRVIQNRPTLHHAKTIEAVKAIRPESSVEVLVPRDSRRNLPGRKAVLDISYGNFDIKKPVCRKADKHLKDFVNMNLIYVKENSVNENHEPIEWILATNEDVSSAQDAFQKVEYYIQRWKIERFHYVLKSGCNIEKLQERCVKKTVMLILMYSIIAVKILNMTYLARIHPSASCAAVFEEDEWRVLFCVINKTSVLPNEPYPIADAIRYVAQLGGFVGSKSDGPPGLKVIWLGLEKLYTLISYRQFLQ